MAANSWPERVVNSEGVVMQEVDPPRRAVALNRLAKPLECEWHTLTQGGGKRELNIGKMVVRNDGFSRVDGSAQCQECVHNSFPETGNNLT